jgi:O-methyltransferase involved in polyketide biosynthesis
MEKQLHVMTPDQADAIIAELNVCFPSKNLVVEEVRRWENNLLTFHFEDARKAVKKIEDHCKFFPSWAEFREAISPLHSHRVWVEKERREAEQKALEKPRTEEDRKEIAKIIAQIKASLSNYS